MTQAEIEAHKKYLQEKMRTQQETILRYGEIEFDQQTRASGCNIRIRVLTYDDKAWISIMLNGEIIHFQLISG